MNSVEIIAPASNDEQATLITPAKGRFGPGLDLRGRDLRGQSLLGRQLDGVDLRKSDLRHADLPGASLYRARLDGADLRGTRLDSARIVEIELPDELGLTIVNQIRHFDFRFGSTRFVAPNRKSEDLPCPYRDASLRPPLFDWGARTWNGGAGWQPPIQSWTLEEIIASVLDALACRHNLSRPFRESTTVFG